MSKTIEKQLTYLSLNIKLLKKVENTFQALSEQCDLDTAKREFAIITKSLNEISSILEKNNK